MSGASIPVGSEPRAPMKARVTKNGYTSGNKRKRGPCLPLDQRLRLYNEVLQLRRQGLSCSQIIERIHGFDGVRLYKSHVSYWVRGLHEPLGKVNKFDGKPSPEFAGVIGVVLGDGNRNLHSNHYGFWLGVKDYEYAYEFSRCLAKVLGRKKPYRPRWSQSKRRWVVEGCSILLFKELNRPWQMLKPYIEASKTCVAAFLRGFIDGEGSISGRELMVYNTDEELLLYIQKLLQQYFRIETTGPHRDIRTRLRDPKNGKIYRRKKTCYRLYVRVHSLPRFHKYIDFAMKRKQRRLIEATQN